MRSHLLEGKVRHRRAHPVTYHLEHDVFYAALDLDEIDTAVSSLRLMAHNRWNALTFRDDDHLDPPAEDLAAAVRARLTADGLDPTGWQVTLVTNLRVFGYVFNPASFYLCRDAAGSLRVVIVEVHNTHGERHLYVLQPRDDMSEFTDSMDKTFYVSPFIEMTGQYRVHLRDERSRLRITINLERSGDLVLHTSLDLDRRPLTDRTILRMLVRHPLVSLKTIALIHWHAFHLWRRGLPFYRHGEVSR
jgi:DUF1365 family protein